VSFVASIVPMAIDGLGLSGHDDHTEKETADLRMLPVQTKRAAVLMYRLSNPK
jgi:glutamate carboxypeptidase